jgi:hypothetical protein
MRSQKAKLKQSFYSPRRPEMAEWQDVFHAAFVFHGRLRNLEFGDASDKWVSAYIGSRFEAPNSYQPGDPGKTKMRRDTWLHISTDPLSITMMPHRGMNKLLTITVRPLIITSTAVTPRQKNMLSRRMNTVGMRIRTHSLRMSSLTNDFLTF